MTLPRHTSNRISAQAACFTVHGVHDSEPNFGPLEQDDEFRGRLIKLNIDPNMATSILPRELDRCGINAATLFPDLDGLCRMLQWKLLPNAERDIPLERRYRELMEAAAASADPVEYSASERAKWDKFG